MERECDEQRTILRAAFDAAPLATLLIDPGVLRVLDANPAACRLLAYAPERLRELPVCELVSCDEAELAPRLQQVSADDQGAARWSIVCLDAAGREVGTEWTVLGVRTGRGTTLVVFIAPTGERCQEPFSADGHLVTRSTCHSVTPSRTDPLTALPDRREFERRLAAVLEAAGQHPERPFAVLFIDLDGFKRVNDTFGHLAGDRVLVEIVARLAGSVRAGDFVARFGGDEFLVLLDGLHSPDDAARVAERIASRLAVPIDVAGRPMTITASIGIAPGRLNASPEELIHEADRAMYRAKSAGQGRY